MMKTYWHLVCISACLFAYTAEAQSDGLRANYVATLNLQMMKSSVLEREGPAAQDQSLSGLLDAFSQVEILELGTLTYKDGMSRFKKDTVVVNGDRSGQFSAGSSRGEIFKDLMARRMLQWSPDVPDVLCQLVMPDAASWRIVPGRDTLLLGYTCFYAEYVRDPSQHITAWYAPDLPVLDGPENYCGLPGLILWIETDRKTIVCNRLELLRDLPDVCLPAHRQVMAPAEYERLISDRQRTMPSIRDE